MMRNIYSKVIQSFKKKHALPEPNFQWFFCVYLIATFNITVYIYSKSNECFAIVSWEDAHNIINTAQNIFVNLILLENRLNNSRTISALCLLVKHLHT